MQRTIRSCGWLLAIGAALRLLAPCGTSGSTLLVMSLNDSGARTLRSLIGSASPGDHITFGVTRTISLTSGELAINKNLDIVGPQGGGVTVQRSLAGGTANIRVFNILGGNTVNLLYLTNVI
jgi:hypothetical protein